MSGPGAATRAMAVAAAGLLLTLTAFTFDAAPLFVPGVAFALVGIAAPLWVLASIRPAALERRLDWDRVIEDEPLEATVIVRRGWVSPPGAELHDPLAPVPVALSQQLSLIRGGRMAQVRIVTRFPRRGLRRLPPPSLTVQDPLGLSLMQRRGQRSAQEVLVLPRTEPIRWHGREGAGERPDGRRPTEPLAAVDIDGLRPYRLGTPASRIHWPAVARRGELLERRLRQDGDTRPMVVLDARGSGPPEHLDGAVRAAASLILELARRGGCRVLLPGERRTVSVEGDLIAWPAIHARLALVEGGPAARAPILGPGARLGAVFYVAAQRLGQLPALLSAPGHGAAIIVLPSAVGGLGARPSFEVAGCSGYVVGGRRRSRRERAA